MKTIKVKIHHDSIFMSILPKYFIATTIMRHILVRKGYTFKPGVLNHELIHVCQWYRLGFFGFLFSYFIKDGFTPYKKKVLEAEAYANQADEEYIQKTYPEFKLEVS